MLSPLPIAKKRERVFCTPSVGKWESPALILIDDLEDESSLSSSKLEGESSLSPLPNWKRRDPSPLFQIGRGESPLPSSDLEEERALSALPIWKRREGSLLF